MTASASGVTEAPKAWIADPTSGGKIAAPSTAEPTRYAVGVRRPGVALASQANPVG